MLPDIVTMNRAHSTHYTDRPDPGIKYVLRGWRDDGKPTDWDVQFQDVRVRSVATNIRDWAGGTQRHGNSIFIFEVANLCIAHLGHLHHTLTQQQLNEIGRVDVVLVPVDGCYTLDLDGMIEVLHVAQGAADDPDAFLLDLHARPLHQRISKDWDVERAECHRWSSRRTRFPQSRSCSCCPAVRSDGPTSRIGSSRSTGSRCMSPNAARGRWC